MWNKEIEKQVTEVYHWAYGFYRLYGKAAVDCEQNKNRMFCLLLTLNICFSTFSGIIVILFSTKDPPKWINIIILILNIISTTLLVIKNKVDEVNDKSSFDLLTQRNYSLFSNIRRQLALPVNQRQQGPEYLQWITKEYEQLNNVNLLDEGYFKWYEKIAEQDNLPMPGLIKNFDVETNNPPQLSKFVDILRKNAQSQNKQNLIISNPVSSNPVSSNPVEPEPATVIDVNPTIQPVRKPAEINTSETGSTSTKKINPNKKTFKTLVSGEDLYSDSRMAYEVSRYME